MNVTVDELQRAVAQQYRVERELGAGGMATVYLAHDPKHDRRVAIKVLRPELAAIVGGERFLKEIRTTANLQHPHILPLHDSGEAGGLVYYVMPFVEGESLRQRLKREKQLPVDEAIRIAREVAGGLDYAHRHGVVHRDVKPENILLHDGQALIADFGIALAVSRTDGGTRMTETGMSLGTPHYMSPEQAMGEREISPKSDVYALGCVLYEMLVGEPPFTGPTPQAIIARVITDEPRTVTGQRRSVPPAVEAAIMRALSKLPADRFASAAEFGDALSARTVSGALPTPRQPYSLRRIAPLGLVGVGAAVVIAAAWIVRQVAAPDEPVGRPARLSVTLPPGNLLFDGGGSSALAMSPDGSTIVYAGETGRGSQLFLRRLVDVSATPVPSTEGASAPIYSRDGSTIWYALGNSFRRMPAAGGSPLPATVDDALRAIFPHPSGVLQTNPQGALIATRPDGSVRVIALPDSSLGEVGVLPQDVLPDGRILAIGQAQGLTGGIWVIDPGNGRRQLVTRALSAAAFYNDGLVAWVLTSGALLAAPLGDGSADLASVATIIADNVRVAPGSPPQITFSRTGSVVYAPARPSDLVRVDRAGRAEVIGLQPRRFHSPRLSPDGRSILADVTEEQRDVWLLSLRDGTFSRLTFDRDGHDPQWLPDGKRFLYATTRTGTVGIHRRSLDGSASDSIKHDGPQLTAHAVTADGKSALAIRSSTTGADVVRVDLASGAVSPIVSTPFNEQYTSLSPDGRWLAYTSNESGREEVYLRSMSGAERIVVSRAGGTEPVWSRDGRELFYRDFEGPSLIAAAVVTSPELRVTGRAKLFGVTDYEGASPHANYDVTPDGKFIFVRTVRATELTYVQNWPAMVRRTRR